MRSLYSVVLRRAAKTYLRKNRTGKKRPTVAAVFLHDLVSTRIALDGIYEGRELDALVREVFPRLPRDSTALDVGANIGNHAAIFAEHFDRVVAFEPNPLVFALLEVNALDAGIETVKIGLSDADATLNFKVNSRNLGGSRVTDGAADTTVEVRALDALSGKLKLNDVSFVKMDVEGHEDKVIAGAARLLARAKPVIALEGWYKTDPRKGDRVESLLRGFGYRYFYCLTDRRQGESSAWHRAIPRLLLRQRPLRLERIQKLIGRDHDMAICATRPIL